MLTQIMSACYGLNIRSNRDRSQRLHERLQELAQKETAAYDHLCSNRDRAGSYAQLLLFRYSCGGSLDIDQLWNSWLPYFDEGISINGAFTKDSLTQVFLAAGCNQRSVPALLKAQHPLSEERRFQLLPTGVQLQGEEIYLLDPVRLRIYG